MRRRLPSTRACPYRLGSSESGRLMIPPPLQTVETGFKKQNHPTAIEEARAAGRSIYLSGNSDSGTLSSSKDPLPSRTRSTPWHGQQGGCVGHSQPNARRLRPRVHSAPSGLCWLLLFDVSKSQSLQRKIILRYQPSGLSGRLPAVCWRNFPPPIIARNSPCATVTCVDDREGWTERFFGGGPTQGSARYGCIRHAARNVRKQ